MFLKICQYEFQEDHMKYPFCQEMLEWRAGLKRSGKPVSPTSIGRTKLCVIWCCSLVFFYYLILKEKTL